MYKKGQECYKELSERRARKFSKRMLKKERESFEKNDKRQVSEF